MGRNYSQEADLIESLGGPGRLIGYGYTQDQAIQLALTAQIARLNDLFAAGCQLAEDIAAQGMSPGTAETRNEAQGEAGQPGPAKQDAPNG